MKVYIKESLIWLESENQDEESLLEYLDKDGARVFARSTRGIGLSVPSEAGLRQLFINREQQAILAYALGLVQQGSDLLGKLDAERKRNAKLLRDLSISLANYAVLERKYNRITGNIDKTPPKPNQNTAEADRDNDAQQ